MNLKEQYSKVAKLYLIPSLLSDNNWKTVLPISVSDIVKTTRYFIVENVRTARRFLKKVAPDINIDELTFYELNKRTSSASLPDYLLPIKAGNNMAVISEAGCPGVADPGAEIVKLAHQKAIEVVPLVGPSSILLALMASGLNGQSFAFAGYLPVKNPQRIKTIKKVEEHALRNNQTQIFIETPYRNHQLIDDLLKNCNSSTLLCIAANITAENEWIKTKSIQSWQKEKLPDLHKQPAIFLIGK